VQNFGFRISNFGIIRLENRQSSTKSEISKSRNPKFPSQAIVACFHLLLVTGLLVMNGLLLNRMDKRVGQRFSSVGETSAPAVVAALGPYGNFIMQASIHYDVDPHLIRAVMLAESNERPGAVSHANARGLMQVMPATAADLGVKRIHALFDPQTNISLGSKYLSMQLERFDGDVRKALIAYNAGPGTVIRDQRLPAETRAYVPKVLRLWDRLQSRAKAEGRQSNVLAERDHE